VTRRARRGAQADERGVESRGRPTGQSAHVRLRVCGTPAHVFRSLRSSRPRSKARCTTPWPCCAPPSRSAPRSRSSISAATSSVREHGVVAFATAALTGPLRATMACRGQLCRALRICAQHAPAPLRLSQRVGGRARGRVGELRALTSVAVARCADCDLRDNLMSERAMEMLAQAAQKSVAHCRVVF
jgi:hypothetical protein